MTSLPFESQEAAALVARAVLAPSSHDTQPWIFRLDGNRVDLVSGVFTDTRGPRRPGSADRRRPGR